MAKVKRQHTLGRNKGPRESSAKDYDFEFAEKKNNRGKSGVTKGIETAHMGAK